MDAQQISTIAAGVVVAVQLAKWVGLKDSMGPIAVILFSVIGVSISVWSSGVAWADLRPIADDLLFALINIITGAAGIFGFTRAAVGAVTNISPPPSYGAGSSPTSKPSSSGRY